MRYGSKDAGFKHCFRAIVFLGKGFTKGVWVAEFRSFGAFL